MLVHSHRSKLVLTCVHHRELRAACASGMMVKHGKTINPPYFDGLYHSDMVSIYGDFD